MKNLITQSLLSIAIATAVSVPAVQADFFSDRSVAVGLQGAGPSVRVPVNETVKGQLIVGALGSVTSAQVRGLRAFGDNQNVDFYGYGSVGMWFWDGGRYYGSETNFGAGLGVGLDYDIRKAAPDMPPIILSAELGANFVSFDHYSSFSMMSVGLGVHYQF